MTVLIDYTKGFFETTEGDTVGTVTGGTETYDLANASYDSKSFSVSTQGNFPFGISLSSDGTKMYVAFNSSNVPVNQYSLSTAFDISTASYSSSYSTGIASGVRSLYIKPDGSKFYVLIADANDSVYQYSMSTYWDITSSSSDSTSFSVNTQESNAHGLTFKPDGTKMYITGQNSNSINEYNLSTAWDVSTASYSQQFTINTQSAISDGVAFNSTGTKFFILDSNTDKVFQYSMTTAWDVSTASYDSINFSVASQETNPSDFYFKPDGTKMYVLGNGNDTVYQYSTGTATTIDLSTGSVFSHTPTANTTFAFTNPAASGTSSSATLKLTGANIVTGYDLANASYDSVSFSVGSQDTFPSSLVFKPDGTKMFVTGYGNDAVQEYSLSTAWDVSTASHSTSFSISSQEPNSQGLFIKPDGTKFWITGNSDKVWQYSISTAWDISTASYDNVNFSTFSQATLPVGIEFKSDGTKMYIIDVLGTQRVYQYSLSTAWDLSTTSYDSVSFSTSSQDATPLDLTFNSDGTKMYMIGNTTDTMYQYSLSTAWDLSTASYDNVSFSVASQETSPRDVFFKPDGTKFYIVGDINDTVYQYTSSSTALATITYPASVIWSGGITPTAPANGETDVYSFYTDDGGTTYYGFVSGDALA